MSRTLALPILMLMVILQSGLMPQLRVLGGTPDLVLLAVMVWSLDARLEDSVFWAILGGVLHDLLSAAPLGLSSVGLVLVVFAVSGLTSQVYRIGIILLAGLVVLTTTAYEAVSLVLAWMTGVPVDLLADLSYVIVPTLVYNLIFIWPIYWILRRIQRRFTTDQRFFQI